MDNRFFIHNAHLEDPYTFADHDPQLRKLKALPYPHLPMLLKQLPLEQAGIYTLGGGRQIGKTTLLKQWMAELLKKGITAQAIVFLTGEIIDDHHSLLHLLQTTLANMPEQGIRYLLCDEITYIPHWEKAIKYAADSGILENVVLMLTGSDLSLMREARMTFPGRRGKADVCDFHLYPLSFKEFIQLTNRIEDIKSILSPNKNPSFNQLNQLSQEFQQYLLHGGYLTAINEYTKNGLISQATLNTYADWIRGDMLKRGKQELYLKEIVTAIIKRYTSQITWNNLAAELSIDHHKTVSDYISLLESMDAVFVQAALLEDKLAPAPKKARRVLFTDPFIYHAIKSWALPSQNSSQDQINATLADPIISAQLVETCVVSYFRRYFPTYYIKAEGEIDVAYVNQNRFWPIEIKWTKQLRPKDLRQIVKYSNGRILTRTTQPTKIGPFTTEFLPLALARA